MPMDSSGHCLLRGHQSSFKTLLNLISLLKEKLLKLDINQQLSVQCLHKEHEPARLIPTTWKKK